MMSDTLLLGMGRKLTLLVPYCGSPGKVIQNFGESEMYREGNVASGRKLGMRCLLIFSLILSLIYSTNKY